MKCIVIIPVYKINPDKAELLSLKQCLRILGKHDISLICPWGLDLTVYQKLFSEYGKEFMVEYFDTAYFKSVEGYNKLMLAISFYQRFSNWDYMLIYQLDAFVFKDELMLWCNRNYDYIGAPWMKLNGKTDPINCGNGGFSLRKIKSFIELFSHTGHVLNLKGLLLFHRYRGPLHKPYYIIRGLLGYKNKLQDYINGERVNEDLFFASLKGKYGTPFHIPSSDVAMRFSFEEHPERLFKQTGILPFGCHAWQKFEYNSFWKKHIKL